MRAGSDEFVSGSVTEMSTEIYGEMQTLTGFFQSESMTVSISNTLYRLEGHTDY